MLLGGIKRPVVEAVIVNAVLNYPLPVLDCNYNAFTTKVKRNFSDPLIFLDNDKKGSIIGRKLTKNVTIEGQNVTNRRGAGVQRGREAGDRET